MKIEIGKQYKVHGTEEDGNVIKITEKKNGLCRYETISGKQPFVDQFACGSLFARLLTPYNEETKIVILRKGNTVTATQYVNTEKVHTGVATCSPDDTFDFAFGAKLALERLLEKPFDWEKFIAGAVWVQVNRTNIDDFLRACEEQHLTYASGDRPTKLNVFRDLQQAGDCGKALFGLLGLTLEEHVWFLIHKGRLMWNNRKPTGEIFEWEQTE